MNQHDHSHEFEPIRGSVSLLVFRLFLILFFIDTSYSLLTLFVFELEIFQNYHYQLIGILFLAHFIKNAFSIYLVLSIVLKWVSIVYFVTDKYIMQREGVLSTKEKIYDLKNIKSVTVQQGLIGKLFHYGDIQISSHGLGGKTENIYISDVSNPEKYKEIFKHCLEVTNYVVS